MPYIIVQLDEVGTIRSYGSVGQKRTACRILEGKLESDDLDDIYGWVGLTLTLAKGDGRMLTGFAQHLIGRVGGLLLRR